ncbi:hypothetical protein [Paenibacillus sp. URB8-2]|uniref:hypothetical protein n=1 Tax=Paenibacillus sp. URB8-2 TaxID=2741301 RepID=UPI0015B9B110|nr:hypothetical protein [Paenibacillus sp. URB8-2]
MKESIGIKGSSDTTGHIAPDKETARHNVEQKIAAEKDTVRNKPINGSISADVPPYKIIIKEKERFTDRFRRDYNAQSKKSKRNLK